MNISVCDSIMGSGKTNAAINLMNNDEKGRYIFITPYLDEVERIKAECGGKRFVSPENKGRGKLDNLHTLLADGRNIASTHALFSAYTPKTCELLEKGGYTLILDEVFGVVNVLDKHADDIRLMVDSGLIAIEDGGRVRWLDDGYSGNDYRALKETAQAGNLFLYGNCLLFWTFPVRVFASFVHVLILTYLFDAQLQKYYYDLNGITVRYIGTKKTENGYVFTDEPEPPDFVRTIKGRIHILNDRKLNAIGTRRHALSASWFCEHRRREKRDSITRLKNNLVNVFRNRWKVPAQQKMWTTFKAHKNVLAGKGYTKGFVPCNLRATNEYRGRTHLAYCANIFFNPFLKKYFISRGAQVDEDKYALSELVQWIWRSSIRDGGEIWIYIPSHRMRGLLEGWLDSLCD